MKPGRIVRIRDFDRIPLQRVHNRQRRRERVFACVCIVIVILLAVLA